MASPKTPSETAPKIFFINQNPDCLGIDVRFIAKSRHRRARTSCRLSAKKEGPADEQRPVYHFYVMARSNSRDRRRAFSPATLPPRSRFSGHAKVQVSVAFSCSVGEHAA